MSGFTFAVKMALVKLAYCEFWLVCLNLLLVASIGTIARMVSHRRGVRWGVGSSYVTRDQGGCLVRRF